MKRTIKERYIPAGYKVIRQNKSAKVVVYGKGLSAMGFSGNKVKHNFYYRFGTKDRMKEFINDFIAGQKQQVKQAAERAKEKAKPMTLKVDDILYNSWGYDQTNIDFFQVVELKGKSTVILKPINGDYTETGFMCGNTVAVKDSFITGNSCYPEQLTKRVTFGNRVSMRHGSCSLWDGKPKYSSSYA